MNWPGGGYSGGRPASEMPPPPDTPSGRRRGKAGDDVMGPIYGTMVETATLCVDGYRSGVYCPGWAEDGGIERRCLWSGHDTRRVRSADAVADAGVTARQFDSWAATGLLRTAARPGSGHYRYLSDREVAVLRLMGRLVAAGMLPQTASRLSHDLWDGRMAAVTDSFALAVRTGPREETTA